MMKSLVLLRLKIKLLLLMVIGSCAGSTGGGMKISRVIIVVKSMFVEIKQIIAPKAVVNVRLDKKPVDTQTLSSTRIYVTTYMLLICFFTSSYLYAGIPLDEV